MDVHSFLLYSLLVDDTCMLKEDRQSHSPATSTSETVLTTLSTDMTPPSQQVSVSPKHIHVANLKSLALVTCK